MIFYFSDHSFFPSSLEISTNCKKLNSSGVLNQGSIGHLSLFLCLFYHMNTGPFLKYS